MTLEPLPPLLLLEDFQGDWEAYQQEVYKVFLDEINKKLTFFGLPVSCRYFEPVEGYHRTFWHLITSDQERTQKDEDRFPDTRRCERIRWIPHIINNVNSADLSCWQNKRGTSRNVLLWLEKHDYLIILSERKGYYMLTSAYITDRNNTRRKLIKERARSTDPRT